MEKLLLLTSNFRKKSYYELICDSMKEKMHFDFFVVLSKINMHSPMAEWLRCFQPYLLPSTRAERYEGNLKAVQLPDCFFSSTTPGKGEGQLPLCSEGYS